MNLLWVVLLIAITAFFVASEFAIVKIRTTRIDQLVEEGNKRAISARKVISDLDEYLSACQLGITLTSLGLGWLGEPAFQKLLEPIFHQLNLPSQITHLISFILAFFIITFFHVVVGELAPKTFAIQKTESIVLAVAKPLIWFNRIAFPFIYTLNKSASLFTRLFGLEPGSEHELAHTEEELRIILSESYKSGEINQSEYRYVNKIFEFDNRLAKEIMVPRTEIVSLMKDDTIDDFIEVAKEEQFTRYPIVDGDKDHVIGMVNIKEVFSDMIRQKDLSTTLEAYTRPIIRVIENIPIHDLLVKMQKDRIHLAILMDEYGGTSGLVTVEDILEEIVGEIRDEFDLDEIAEIRKIKDGHYILDSKVLLSEVNDLLGLTLNEEDIDTIGGWMLTEKYEVQAGDFIEWESYMFRVLEMEEHSIKYIEVTKLPDDSATRE
ncbi:CBS domain containing-hemolysin-like protein [Peribacillus deserti]|uniref:CBS domain containing-hemolysin-like protein n=1 Tax=Peribacillus deserti TaxID=673318 RepID=A0ABS2QMA1_9BACI|nr:CBS domain containing-hemolysin-like protein [Peribacillus deserti]